MRKKKKAPSLHNFGRPIITLVIIGFLSSAAFGKQNNVRLSEDVSSESQTPGSETFAIEGLVTRSKKDVDQITMSNNKPSTDEMLLEVNSQVENGKISNNQKDDFEMDPIFNEIIEPSLRINKGNGDNGAYGPFQYVKGNTTSTYLPSKQPYLYNAFYGFEDYTRDQRGAVHLYGIIKCATGCNPLSFKGYGCFCGFQGSGEPVDAIDMCCKMHDWCYTTTSCHGLEWDLPYFVPFKWKCNGGSPYCIPGKSQRTGRNSCSHQLCECDREFAMCLNKHRPCPRSKAACKNKKRLWQNILMAFGSGHGMHHPHKSGATYFPNKPTRFHPQKETPRTLNNHFNPFKHFG